MRLLQILPAFLAALAATSGMPASAHSIPSAPLQFEALFFGIVELGQEGTLEGPFGTRVNIPINSLNLTDTSGKLVATLVNPSADTGIISDSGTFFPEVVLALRWEVDQKLAYLALSGVGELFSSVLLRIHLETDSQTYKSLNSRFLVANVTFPPEGEGGNPTFTFYGAK